MVNRINMQKALAERFEKTTFLRVRVRCTRPPLTNDGRSLVGRPLANKGHVDPADVHVRCVVARVCTVHGRVAGPLLPPSGVVAAYSGYRQCSRQPYSQVSHRAVAVDHYCPHKVKAVLDPLVTTQSWKKFMCSMPRSGHPFEKGGNHLESLDSEEQNASTSNLEKVDTEAG